MARLHTPAPVSRRREYIAEAVIVVILGLACIAMAGGMGWL